MRWPAANSQSPVFLRRRRNPLRFRLQCFALAEQRADDFPSFLAEWQHFKQRLSEFPKSRVVHQIMLRQMLDQFAAFLRFPEVNGVMQFVYQWRGRFFAEM